MRLITAFIVMLLFFAMPAFAGVVFYDAMDDSSKLPPDVDPKKNDFYRNSHGNVAGNILVYSEEQSRLGSGSYKFVLAPYAVATDWASDVELGPYPFQGIYSTPANFEPGETYWMGFSVFVPSGQRWPEGDVNPEGGGTEWALLWQLHGSGNECDISGINPVQGAYLTTDDEGYISGSSGYLCRNNGDPRQCLTDRNYEYKFSKRVPFDRGTWHDIVLNFRFSATTAGNPFYTMWIDNALAYHNTDPNMYNLVSGRGPYFMFGCYGHMTASFTVYFDELRVAIADASTGYDDVSPGGGSVPNQSPNVLIISPSGPLTINVGDVVSFGASGNDPDGSISSWLWNYGASGIANSYIQNPLNQQFNIQGSFNVTVTGTDNDGASSSDSVAITVGTVDPPPPDGDQEIIRNGVGVRHFSGGVEIRRR